MGETLWCIGMNVWCLALINVLRMQSMSLVFLPNKLRLDLLNCFGTHL